MATSTQLAQAFALKKANPNLTTKDAVLQTKQTTTPVTPAPVTPAPVTPPITPSPQTVPGVNGEQFQVATVNPNTGLSQPPVQQTPQSVAPTQPVSPNTPTPTQNVSQTTPVAPTPAPTPDATIKAQTESQMAINKHQADLKEQERLRIAEEQKAANTPKSASEMYNLITAKAPIAEELKTTPQYRVAQNRYQRASKYLTMTPTQISNEMKNGKFIEGSDAWNDVSTMNPKLIQDTVNLRNVNGNKTNIWTYSNNPDGTPVKENNLEKQFASDFLDDYGSFLREVLKPDTIQDFQNAVYTQDVKDAQDKATSYETELNAIEKDMDKIEKDVNTELTGSGATGSRARLEKIARKEALQSEYNSVLKSYTTYANKANNLITQNTTAYQNTQTQKNLLNQAIVTAGGQKYANKLALNQKQAEYDQQIAQQAQAMGTPELAIPAMIEEYKKLGIPFTRSTQQVIADFKASGQDLGTYLSELQGTIQSKPEYKKIQELQMGQLSDAQKMSMGYAQDINKMAIGNQYDLTKMGINNQQDISKLMLNYNLGNQKDIQSSKIDLMGKGFTPDQADAIVRTATGNWKGATGETLLSAPDSTIIPSRLSETTNPNGGKECGEYVNDIVGSGTVGSTWASKSGKIDSSITTPTVGNTAVWIPDPSNKQFAQYGHAGIITATDGTNVTIKSSNLNGQGEVSTITVPISEIKKTGGFIGTAIKGPGKTSGLNKDEVKNINGLYDDLKSIDTFKNWKAISSQVTWFNDLKNKELNGSDIQGLITNYAKVLDPTSVVRESEFAMAKAGANQGAIDRAKTSIMTYINGGSASLSKEAQEALKSAMSRRFDAVKEAYVSEVDAQVARGKQMGMPVTWENLTGESRDSYTKGMASTKTTNPLSVDQATQDALNYLNQ